MEMQHISQINGWQCIGLEQVDSTNAFAKRMLQQHGLQQKTVVVAQLQTRGYGRADHSWESVNDLGLWMSAIINVEVDITALSQSTLVLAVAVQHAIQQVTSCDLQIKWPNDLYGDGKKCSGLLVEMSDSAAQNDSHQSHTLILGVGLNVNHTTVDFSTALTQSATSLALLLEQGHIDKSILLRCILESIDLFFSQWQRAGFSVIREAWLQHSYTLGKAVLLPSGYGFERGVATGLSESGALQVRVENDSTIFVDSGEVFFVPDFVNA